MNWGTFNLTSDDMFYIDPVPTFKSTSSVNQDGKYDVVGATSRNNGNVGFVSEENKHFVCQGNCICLIKTGQGSVGEAVYKNNAFIPSNNVYVIRSNWLKKCSALFVVTAINKQADRYSYGYIRNSKRVAREKILLPTTAAGKPDYEFMEQYIRESEATLIAGWRHYLGELEGAPAARALDAVKWGEFNLTDIFTDIQRGRRLKREDHIAGEMPYVSSSAMSNGVDNYVANTDGVRIFSDCLTLANSGSVGTSFYQPFSFVASDHVTGLKNAKLDKYHYLFIAMLLSRLSEKYNFNREINDQRISRERILLPTTAAGQPDYEFMESYAKHLIAAQYRRYLDYLERTGR